MKKNNLNILKHLFGKNQPNRLAFAFVPLAQASSVEPAPLLTFSSIFAQKSYFKKLFILFIFHSLFSCQQYNSATLQSDIEPNNPKNDTWKDKDIPSYYTIVFDNIGSINRDEDIERVIIYNTGEFTGLIGKDSFFVQELIVYKQTNDSWTPIYKYTGDNIFLKESFLYENSDNLFTRSFNCYIEDNSLVLEDYTNYGTPEIRKKRYYQLNEYKELALTEFRFHEKLWDKTAQFHTNNPDREYVNTFIHLDILGTSYAKQVYWGEEIDEDNPVLDRIHEHMGDIITLSDSFNLNKGDFEAYEHYLFEDPHPHYFFDPIETYDTKDYSPYDGVWHNTSFIETMKKQRAFKSLDTLFPIQNYGKIRIKGDSIIGLGWDKYNNSPWDYVWIDSNVIRTTDHYHYLKVEFDLANSQMKVKAIEYNTIIWEHTYSKNTKINIDYNNYSSTIKKYCLEGNYIDPLTNEELRISSDKIGLQKYTIDDYYNSNINTNENLFYLHSDGLDKKMKWNSCWEFKQDTLKIYSTINNCSDPEYCNDVKRGKLIKTLILKTN